MENQIANLKSQVQDKLAELAQESLLLDEIEDACQSHGEWTILAAVQQRHDELTEWRGTVIRAYHKMFGA